MKPLLLPRILFWTGVVLITSPLIGMAMTSVSMIREFNNLDSTGTGDPSVMAEGISNSLLWTAGGVVVCLFLGIPLLVAGILLRRRRPAAIAG